MIDLGKQTYSRTAIVDLGRAKVGTGATCLIWVTSCGDVGRGCEHVQVASGRDG